MYTTCLLHVHVSKCVRRCSGSLLRSGAYRHKLYGERLISKDIHTCSNSWSQCQRKYLNFVFNAQVGRRTYMLQTEDSTQILRNFEFCPGTWTTHHCQFHSSILDYMSEREDELFECDDQLTLLEHESDKLSPKSSDSDQATKMQVHKKRKNRHGWNDEPLLFSRSTGEYLAEVLQPYLCLPKLDIHELFPGRGVLTEALLDGGLKQITIWEPRDQFIANLQEVEKSFPGCISVQNMAIFSHFARQRTSHVEYERLSLHQWKLLWKQEPKLKLIGLAYDCNNYQKIFHLMISALQQRIFPFNRGRPELLLLVGPLEYALMTLERWQLKKLISKRHMLYRLLWEVETLAKVPLVDFNVNVSQSDRRRVKKDDVDWDSMYLVRLCPSPKLFKTICPWEQLPGLIFMGKKISRDHNLRLIPLIEDWCPGIGPMLLKMGYTMTDKAKDLKVEDLPRIYKEMLNRPSDSYSGLRMEMEKLIRH